MANSSMTPDEKVMYWGGIIAAIGLVVLATKYLNSIPKVK